MADVSKIQLPDNTVLNIKDSRISDVGTFVQKSGGTMNAEASLTFTDSDGLYTVEIDHEGIIVMDDDDGFSISIDAGSPSITISESSDYTQYFCGNIRYHYDNDTYNLLLPRASGTLALTSDVPTVESLTTSEIDSIWTNAS